MTEDTSEFSNSPINQLGYNTLRSFWLPWTSCTDQQAIQKSEETKRIIASNSSASFAENSFVSPQAAIFTSTLSLGRNTWVASFAHIRGNVRIGNDCSINPYAHIAGNVEIGDETRIASHAIIMGFNHGFSSTTIPIKDQPHTSKGINIGRDVWVGAHSVILDGVTISDHAIVAAGAVVTKNVGAYQIVAGNPAKPLRSRLESKTTSGQDMMTPHQRIRDLLHPTDPYLDFTEILPLDLQGWGSTHSIFKELIISYKPSLIVEVGTWKGASAIHMANIVKEESLKSEIVCVDTWLGNWQHWSRTEGIGSLQDLQLRNGYPTLYNKFMSNVIQTENSGIITPFPITGIAAAKFFLDQEIRPNLVYIDGDHEYESVISDLDLWINTLDKDNGILLGDDYEWPGVARAAREIADKYSHKLTVFGNKFTIGKST